MSNIDYTNERSLDLALIHFPDADLAEVLVIAEILKDYMVNGPDGELATDVVLADAEENYGALVDGAADLFFDNFGPDDSYVQGDTISFVAEDEYGASPEFESAVAQLDAELNDIDRADAGLLTYTEAEDAASAVLDSLLASVHQPLAEILYDRTEGDEVAVLTYVLTGPRDRVLNVQDAFRQVLEAAGQRVQ